MRFDPHQLEALSAVLRTGSFASAALALHVTPSAISQRIKALEERVGASLVRRGQPCTGTEAGRRLARHAEDVAILEQRVVEALSIDGVDRPTRVRVAVNADSLATWFIPAMVACHPLLFDLVLDDENHTADWLRRGEVSAAVTAHREAVPGCHAEPLGRLRYVATASPAYVERWFAGGVTAERIARAPSLSFDAKDALQRRWIADHFGLHLDPPSHTVPSTQAFLDATREGLGWCLNPVQLAQPYLAEGAIVPLLPDAELHVPLSWQVSRILAPALAPVTSAVREAAAAALV